MLPLVKTLALFFKVSPVTDHQKLFLYRTQNKYMSGDKQHFNFSQA